jgi:GDPmannose 4,6-dehydratase
MLQADKPDDFVVATGKAYSVRDLLDVAFSHLGLDWKKHVEVDPRYFRPSEVDHLCGDPGKAKKALGWEPIVHFQDLVKMMVDHDLELARQEKTLRDAGHVPAVRGGSD